MEKDLETLLDPIFTGEMVKLHVPGAAIAIVRDGKIIFTKGYGVADVETKAAVIPDITIFRIGSITKVFTATAVMQLADKGKIRLDDDVNKYLKSVKIPGTYSQPVTFSDLLTHTSGLDEISPGRRTSNEAEIIPLAAFLKTRIVRRLPPRTVIAYSTYNPSVAAIAVEDITGTPFKNYLDQNIFLPLAMDRTSIAALKKEHLRDLASGYEYAGNSYQKLPFQWFHTYPASDINSTVTDMARFMIANLAAGQLDGRRILSARAMREMHATHFRNHPRIPGWAYGFYEGERNGLRFIEHGGTMDDGYSALMMMIPGKNIGIFLACNTENGASELAGRIKKEFFDRYFPFRPKTSAKTFAGASSTDLKRFGGEYRPDIYCHTCAPNTAYMPEPFSVTVNNDGTISFRGDQWRRIGPLLFELVIKDRPGQIFLGFRENERGEITHVFLDSYKVFERVVEKKN
jgi:CubicO group peptidase (beta-lactamase class C family)